MIKGEWSLEILHLVIMLATVLLASATLVCASEGGEFALDKHTLMLAHFNDQEGFRKADYANGWDEFAGSGWKQIDGYYGKAIDLRGIQFDENFSGTAWGHLPYYSMFGIWPRGNVNYERGTYEFWFRCSPEGMKQNYFGNSLFFFHYFRPFGENPTIFAGPSTMTPYQTSWHWPFFDKTVFQGRYTFDPRLNPDQWHHYAMTWSIDGEMVIYIDGRPIGVADMKGKKGLVLHAHTHRCVGMNSVALDELRVSDIVRYSGPFEPEWRDGKRPDYAVAGDPELKISPDVIKRAYVPGTIQIPARSSIPNVKLGDFSFSFDRETGLVTGFGVEGKEAERNANGVLLWEGYDRVYLAPDKAENWKQSRDSATFEQTFGGKVRLLHQLTTDDAAVKWHVTYRNLTDEQLLLESLMSLPVPMKTVDEYFDGSWIHDKLILPRRRFHYSQTMPLAAVSGEGRVIGVGIDPHVCVSDLLSEWIPEGESGTFRQGTRIVLDAGQSLSLDFFILTDVGAFGIYDALDAYYEHFGDLYKLRKETTIYNYMPVAVYHVAVNAPDMNRLCYVGSEWGHGPGNGKGDEWGTEHFWDNPELAEKYPSYKPATRYAGPKTWGSLDLLHAMFEFIPKMAYCYQYTTRRFHYLPNMPGRYIVKELYPEGIPEDDPLNYGNIYEAHYIVNEFNTPLGKRFTEHVTLPIMKAAADYSPGFINDMCHTSVMRHTDPIALKSEGRGFSRDRGVYLRGAFGHADRYRMINAFHSKLGYEQAIWSDGGIASYILCANSAQLAIEFYGLWAWHPGQHSSTKVGRYMLGGKGMVLHCNEEGEDIGRYFSPEQFTPETLRDYYRYYYDQLMLLHIRDGITFSSRAIRGRQAMMEKNPILVESITLGCKVHPAARIETPPGGSDLWAIRSGEGLDSLLVIGNSQPEAVRNSLTLINRYFGGAPIFGAYFGGEVSHQIDSENTGIADISVKSRDIAAFKCLALLHTQEQTEVTSSFSGDGITMQAILDIHAKGQVKLELNAFHPIYEVVSVSINGETRTHTEGDPIMLPPDRNKVIIHYKNSVFDFAAAEWKKAELLKDGKTNFCIVGEDRPGFAHGTGMLLNQFLLQYDVEDGVADNQAEAAIYRDRAPEAYDGWKIVIEEPDPLTGSGRVSIDVDSKEVHLTGKTLGQIRRTMVVFLRLVDRKYPHIGRYTFGLREKAWERQRTDEKTKEFFAAFSDSQFLVKPILHEEYEHLYTKGNMDFAGKYSLRFAPYIFEPTFGDNFIYGYDGPATFKKTQQLMECFDLPVMKRFYASKTFGLDLGKLE